MKRYRGWLLGWAATVMLAALTGCFEKGDVDRAALDRASTESGNPEFQMPTPASTSGGPDSNVIPTCSYDNWPSPESPRERNDCYEEPDSWRCVCAGETRAQDKKEEESCEQALQSLCQIDVAEPSHCEARGGGVCWPDGERWECGCVPEAVLNPPAVDGGAVLTTTDSDGRRREVRRLEKVWATQGELELDLESVSAESCDEAAFSQCASVCESALGTCTPDAHAQTYTCDCALYPMARSGIAASCEDALRQCDPEATATTGGLLSFGCASLWGFCDVSPESMHCGCADGSSETVPFGEGWAEEVGLTAPARQEEVVLLGNEECSVTLNRVCPAPSPVEGERSYSTETGASVDGGASQQRTRKCTLMERGDRTHDCTCVTVADCHPQSELREVDGLSEDPDMALEQCFEQDAAFLAALGRATEPCPSADAEQCSQFFYDRHCEAIREGDGYRCDCYSPFGDAEALTHYPEGEQCESALDQCTELDLEAFGLF